MTDHAGPAPAPSGLPRQVVTDRLLLRQWRLPEDIAALQAVYDEPGVLDHLLPMDLDATTRQVTRFAAAWSMGSLAPYAVEHRETGRLIGRAGLMRHGDWPVRPDPCEVGWVLASSMWRQGLATEAGLATLRLAWDHLPDREVISIARPTNVASRKVMSKVGLDYQGRTRWRDLDVVWYAADRAGWHDPATLTQHH